MNLNFAADTINVSAVFFCKLLYGPSISDSFVILFSEYFRLQPFVDIHMSIYDFLLDETSIEY